MKVAQKLVFLFRDPQGFGAALYDALQPSSQSFLERSDETFELSLEQYGIKGQKACGNLANFVDDKGQFQVSLLLVEYHEPPILACVINEIFRSIRQESPSSTSALILPYVLPAAKLKCDDITSSVNNKNSKLYGLHMGPMTDFTQSILGKAEKPPSSLQIHYEPLACLLQIVQCFKFPTALFIGKRGMREEDEVLHEVGELFASAFGLCFLKSRIKLNLRETPKTKEPWRQLYG